MSTEFKPQALLVGLLDIVGLYVFAKYHGDVNPDIGPALMAFYARLHWAWRLQAGTPSIWTITAVINRLELEASYAIKAYRLTQDPYELAQIMLALPTFEGVSMDYVYKVLTPFFN
jgi:hypothetical protein